MTLLMKKTILLLALTSVLLSCSSSDNDGEKNLDIGVQNARGTWFPKSIIKPDGTLVPYENLCPTKKDSIIMFYTGFNGIDYIKHFPNTCVVYDNDGCDGSINGETGEIYGCGTQTVTTQHFAGYVTQLTNKTMKIEYSVTKYDIFNYYDDAGCVGIILSRDKE